jgi:hypothetical protein
MQQNRSEVNLWSEKSLFLFYGGRDGGLFTPAADTYLLPSAEAVACTARSADD